VCLLRGTDWVFKYILKRSLHLMPVVWPEVSVRKALTTAWWIKVHNALCGSRAKGDFATTLNVVLHVSHTAPPPLFSQYEHQNSVLMQWPLKFFLRTRTVHLTWRTFCTSKNFNLFATYVYQKDERAPNGNFQSPKIFYFPVLLHPQSQISVWLFVGLVFGFSLVYFFLYSSGCLMFK
jgi:hypothetical protein